MPERMLRVALGQVRVGDHVSEDVEKIASFLRRGRELGSGRRPFSRGRGGRLLRREFHDPADLDGDAVEQGLLRIQQVARETGVAAAVVPRAAAGWPPDQLAASHLRPGRSACGVRRPSSPPPTASAIRRAVLSPWSTSRACLSGLQICYDQRFPEPWRVLALRGAQVVLHCSNACVPGDTWKIPVIEAHLRSRAAENGFFVVSVNHGGPSQNWGSVIYDPHGLEVARAGYDCEELVPADPDLTRVSTPSSRNVAPTSRRPTLPAISSLDVPGLLRARRWSLGRGCLRLNWLAAASGPSRRRNSTASAARATASSI